MGVVQKRLGLRSGLVFCEQTVGAWPDLIVGAGVAVLNIDAAREVWEAARDEVNAKA